MDKNNKKVQQGPQKNDSLPILDIILADEIDPELLSKWPRLKSKVPCVFLHRPAMFSIHKNKILSMGIKIDRITSRRRHDIITLASFEDHMRITQYFDKLQLPYHTYGHPSNRKLKVVIKRLPKNIDLDRLKEELTIMSIPVIRMHKMHFKNIKRHPLFVLAVAPFYNGKEILKLKSVLGKEVKLEPLKIKMIQCYRCQRWGHSQRYCHGVVKCVKCGKVHLYTKCTRDLEKRDPQCANCGQKHTANYKECIYCPLSKNWKPSKKIKEPVLQIEGTIEVHP